MHVFSQRIMQTVHVSSFDMKMDMCDYILALKCAMIVVIKMKTNSRNKNENKLCIILSSMNYTVAENEIMNVNLEF